PELELALDSLLLHRRLLVALDIRRHLIECLCEASDLVARLEIDAGAVVAARDTAYAVAQRRQVLRQARGQRNDADERKADEAEAEGGVARARLAQVLQRIADRACDAEA